MRGVFRCVQTASIFKPLILGKSVLMEPSTWSDELHQVWTRHRRSRQALTMSEMVTWGRFD